MTTVAQLIEHLKTLPQDAIVQCLVERQSIYSLYTQWENLIIDENINVCGNRVEIGER